MLLLFSLAACNRGLHNNDAVRQGVIDHLSKAGLNVTGMDITLSSVQFNGNQADATVSITPKGGSPAQGMSMNYHLEQQGSKWVVTGRKDAGGSPHGGGAMPGRHAARSESPCRRRRGAFRRSRGQMPSPEDLPPAGKKKNEACRHSGWRSGGSIRRGATGVGRARRACCSTKSSPGRSPAAAA